MGAGDSPALVHQAAKDGLELGALHAAAVGDPWESPAPLWQRLQFKGSIQRGTVAALPSVARMGHFDTGERFRSSRREAVDLTGAEEAPAPAPAATPVVDLTTSPSPLPLRARVLLRAQQSQQQEEVEEEVVVLSD